ncbi:MAG: hypothetical protein ACRC2T_12290 [Thermoguttaceae bacterium]
MPKSFNGAALWESGKLSGVDSDDEDSSSFNGAALWESGKPHVMSIDTDGNEIASMGPLFGRAENGCRF